MASQMKSDDKFFWRCQFKIQNIQLAFLTVLWECNFQVAKIAKIKTHWQRIKIAIFYPGCQDKMTLVGNILAQTEVEFEENPWKKFPTETSCFFQNGKKP